ncbi:DUF6119 family protein [Leucobacter massiliensis]|uniref:Sporadically distributed protein, TIGR04141 family n=1 Tax=Leucobacter massiliensis TaxID=1686285 RepID=A0A2S9QPT0_9MICO|nr:DUF6119 family protein [Leucobacter massiliensis]PRI11585.1 hypothetical protein B4915_05565 [Leucobacter massiliensis]
MATRSMSIYLLKPGITVEESIKDNRGYQEVEAPSSVIPNLRVFLKPGNPKQPWWKTYLGVESTLSQQSNSAMAFVQRGKRVFALAFGAGHHLLKEDAFVHDFGTRVVLNAVDPNKLKSTDTLDPESSQRRRTQIPYDGDLALLSFTSDSSVLKSLTGKAKAEYSDLVRSVTGAASLRVTTPTEPGDLALLLKRLHTLYKSKDFRRTFPDIAQVRPVTDPAIVDPLNEQLAAAVFDLTAPIVLTVPDVLDYHDEAYVQFSGRGLSEMFDDVYIKHYREYVEGKGATAQSFTVDDLKHDELLLLDGNYEVRQRWSIFRSLVFETQEDEGYSYHFSDGAWFQVATGLLESLQEFLDPYWVDATLPPHTWTSEAEYNSEVSAATGSVCLDQTSMSPSGQTQVEPCDILRIGEQSIEFVHVKIGTSSATLSHLFNQAANSVHLLRTSEEAARKLLRLVEDKAGARTARHVADALESNAYSVSIAIVSHKQTPEKKSANLPVFSRISLRRVLIALKAMRIPITVQLIPDATDRAGRAKPRKPRRPRQPTPQ